MDWKFFGACGAALGAAAVLALTLPPISKLQKEVGGLETSYKAEKAARASCVAKFNGAALETQKWAAAYKNQGIRLRLSATKQVEDARTIRKLQNQSSYEAGYLAGVNDRDKANETSDNSDNSGDAPDGLHDFRTWWERFAFRGH